MASTPGIVPRDVLNKAFNGNDRMIKSYDLLQQTVFDDPFINAGNPEASVSAASLSLPIVIDGVTYYVKLSTTP